jgi:phosphodiesterase/alkaline phosphatase D-like protein
MRRVATVCSLIFFFASLACAQDERAQNVQITKGPRVESVTNDTAEIAWSTNVNASTLVRYGTDVEKLTSTAQEPWGGLTHRVTIRNLRPGTTYYFQAESNHGQGTGTKATSDVASFTTRGQSASALPQGSSAESVDPVKILAGPIPQKVTEHSAEIWWESDRPSDTIVKYGTTPQDLSEIKQKPWGDQVHRVELTGLRPDTKYFVAAVNSEGTVRAQASFKTSPAAAEKLRIVDGPRVEFIGANSAVIAWTTNVPGNAVLHYGTRPENLTESADAGSGATHRATLHHLRPNTIYYFSPQSGSDSSAQVSSGIAPFRTVGNAQEGLRFNPQP